MIEVFTGKLGGGKSYHAVARMMRQLAKGGLVVSNIHLEWEAVVEFCASKYGVQVRPEQYRQLRDEMEMVDVVSATGKTTSVAVSSIYNFHSMVPQGTFELPVLVVIDEAHLYFNSRDYATTDKLGRAMLSYLTQSRKLANDIILITQDWRNLDAQFIRLLQYLWKFRDMSRFRIPGTGIPWLCQWPVIGRWFPELLAVQLDQDGVTQLERVWSRKDLRIFGLYSSEQMLRPVAGVSDEAFHGVQLEQTTQKKKMIRLLPIAFVVALVLAITGAVKLKNKIFPKEEADPVAAYAPVKAQQPVLEAPRRGTLQDLEIATTWEDRPGGWMERQVGYYAVTRRIAMTEEGRFEAGQNCEFGRVESVSSEVVVVRGWAGERYRLRLFRSRRSAAPGAAGAEGIGG